ncbi:hypothetical protein [Streptomyces sp. NPDC057363]|uniref:hypothetical protein n=1 Tax=Streptomyces sp. NPDC057363 TaxID=3346107 RepID=UPI0036300A75
MSLDGQVDVVVIGFGVAGAAAALAAAGTGARVLALEQRGLVRKDWRGPSPRVRSRSALRSAALAAGVQVRPLSRAHELLMDADNVRGVGYAALPEQGSTSVVYRWLDQLGHRATHSGARSLARMADRIWQSAFMVGEIACASVILALDPRHWDFVGPAMWTASRSVKAPKTMPTAAPTRHLRLVAPEEGEVDPTPELSARLWCAQSEAVVPTPGQRRELRVDEETGAVLIGDGAPVPGLYSAMPTEGGGRDCGLALAAGTQAGRQAADSTVDALRCRFAHGEGQSVNGR